MLHGRIRKLTGRTNLACCSIWIIVVKEAYKKMDNGKVYTIWLFTEFKGIMWSI